MKVVVITALIILSLTGITGCKKPASPDQKPVDDIEHLYVSWDTMEFDKCVAVWLITRFIDPNAQFEFVPQDTELNEGILFDVPGADWSRKHRKCTSQCIWEAIDVNNPAVERIVDMAGKIELNFWQLDRWPGAQEHFRKIRTITNSSSDTKRCFQETNDYFDSLYAEIKQKFD